MKFGTLLWDILEVKNLNMSKRGMWSIDLSGAVKHYSPDGRSGSGSP